ncbi:MAG: protein-methionine-sulfoxide reductase heme-binding subunit MsrQ [Rhodobacteraceae bacterium]|nr:protein-methionine-sulfoxide reductase heme-binding subunit MsrQ [Paracoccaceae bacterium]
MTLPQRINGVLRRIPAWPIYIIGPVPGLWVFWLALNNRLGPDPLQVLEHSLGERALQFIILTLLITPILRLTRVSLLKFRRSLGVVAFIYVLGHLLTWVILDQQLSLAAIWTEIVKRPYITIGMVGFLAMVPLAVTSNNLSVRRLGPALWRRIHKLAYLAAFAGAAHYLLLVKAWPTEPIVYAAIVVSLLAIRAWWAFSRRAR